MKSGKLSFLAVIKLVLAAIVTSLIVFFIGISLVSCGGDDSGNDPDPVIAPTITSFTPVYGLPGSSLTLTGTNFDLTTSKNKVKINGTAATVTSATQTELIITVPEATTGKISIAIGEEEAISTEDFEVLKDFPRNGLVGFYPFSGTGAEATGHTSLDFNLSLTDSPTFAVDRFAKTNQALSFNGAQTANASAQIIPGNPWTISVWIKYTSLLNNSAFLATMSNSIGMQLHFTVRGNNQYAINVYGGDGVSNYQLSNATSGFLPETGSAWINITLTFDGTTYKVYKDGIEVESRVITATSTPGPQLLLGRSSTDQFTGFMDDLIVYNRALSAAEVLNASQQTVSKY